MSLSLLARIYSAEEKRRIAAYQLGAFQKITACYDKASFLSEAKLL